jgi:predicted transcriptional regulator
MVEQLFGSKTRVKLLYLFYTNPKRSFYVREITRKIDEQINSVRRELSNLLSIGIISSDGSNNKLYYEVNQKYEFYDPLSQIFGQGVTNTPGGVTIDSSKDIKAVGNVHLAIMTGQFTRDETSGIDLLIVGDVNENQLENYIHNLEKKESKELRYAVMSKADFLYRRKVNDRFVALVLDSKHQVIVEKKGILSTDEQDESDKKEE